MLARFHCATLICSACNIRHRICDCLYRCRRAPWMYAREILGTDEPAREPARRTACPAGVAPPPASQPAPSASGTIWSANYPSKDEV